MELSSTFLQELFKACIRNRSVFLTVKEHLSFEHLPTEEYKFIWKSMIDYDSAKNKMPTVGVISTYYPENPDILSLLKEIKNIHIDDYDTVLDGFEEFITSAMFVEFYNEIGNLFSSKEKIKAEERTAEYVKWKSTFSIRDNYYTLLVADYQKRAIARLMKVQEGGHAKIKVPFFIDQLDKLSAGGIDETDTALFLAQSGVGKSKLLKHIGKHAVYAGFRVLHVQAEGSREDAEDQYDSTLTGQELYKVKYGKITEEDQQKIDRALKGLKKEGGELILHSFTEDETRGTMADVYRLVEDVEKTHGHVDLILIDYLEKLEPGDGRKYKVSEEKARRNAIAERMKELAVFFKTRVVTATQASTVDNEDLNDPEKHMTRYNISMDKALINPFSYFVTMNQTDDELKTETMRLFPDKIRDYMNRKIPFFIKTNYNINKFYDKNATLSAGWFVPAENKMNEV